MKKLHFAIAFLAFLPVVTFAQRTWFEMSVSKDITKKLELDIATEIRFNEGFELNEYFLESGLEYKFSKYFSLGGNYRLGNNFNKKGESQWYGRFAFDAKTGYEWKKLGTQLRVRYTNADDFSDDDAKINYLRYKFKLDYSLKKLDLKPYLSYELYQNLDDKEFNKSRYEASLEYKINKHHRIGAYYRINDYFTDDESVKIIGFTYKLKL